MLLMRGVSPRAGAGKGRGKPRTSEQAREEGGKEGGRRFTTDLCASDRSVHVQVVADDQPSRAAPLFHVQVFPVCFRLGVITASRSGFCE